LTRVFSVAHVVLRELASDAEANDRSRVLGAGAPPALLMATAQQRTKAGIAAHIEHADAFRRVQLVAGKREHVDLGVLEVDGHLADGLDGVGVEEDALLVRHFGHLLDGKQVPVSLLAHIAETIATRSLSSDLYSSRSMRPLRSTRRRCTT
jgi:hypothetical protein